jgi:hypothetical protein
MQISCQIKTIEISTLLKNFVPNLAQSYPHFIHKIAQMQFSSAFEALTFNVSGLT